MTPSSRLIARITPLAGDIDLSAVAGDDGMLWEHEGDGLATKGEALRIHLPGGLAAEPDEARVATALAAIDVVPDGTRAQETARDVAGVGPVALGALPFDPAVPASLVVPRVAVRRLPDGRAWRTTIGPAGAAAAETANAPTVTEERRPPDAFTLTSTVGHAEFCELVAAATKEIAAGTLDKVVLAREVVVTTNRPILTSDVVARLLALYPSCMVFSIEGFVGASPELLVSQRGQGVRSHPLAGTFPRSGDPRSDAALAAQLTGSRKDRWEHQLVVDAVVEGLHHLGADVVVPEQPEILLLRNVLHLGTEITATLPRAKDGGRARTALDVVAALHPTPAVAGTPRDTAVAHLHAAENFNRGRYAGVVGWVDQRGDGDWAIAIRSAELAGTRARLFAGVGIVDGSDPEAELAETQLKLQALLAAVVRP